MPNFHPLVKKLFGNYFALFPWENGSIMGAEYTMEENYAL